MSTPWRTVTSTVFLGVTDVGSIVGLDTTDVRTLNQLISIAASQHMRPSLHS